MLTLKIDSNFTRVKAVQVDPKDKIQSLANILKQRSEFDCSDKLILKRGKNYLGRLGPLMTFEDYDVKDGDTILYWLHLGGPMLHHYQCEFGLRFKFREYEHRTLDKCVDSIEYGNLAEKNALTRPLAGVRNMVGVFWEFDSSDGNGYKIDTSNLDNVINLYSWSKSLNRWNAHHEPCKRYFVMLGSSKSYLYVNFPRSTWIGNLLYAFCVNFSLDEVVQKDRSEYLTNLLTKNLPLVLISLVCDYDYFSINPHKEFERIKLKNSLDKFVGYLSGCYSGHFTFSADDF